MKLRSFFAIAALSVLAFAACEPAEENLGEAKISVSPAEVTFGSAEEQKSVTLIATRDWHIFSQPEWVAIDKTEGSASTKEQTVNISVEANKGHDREGELIFTIGLARASLVIKQTGEAGEIKKGSGTKEDPFTVAGAIEYVKALEADKQTTDQFFVVGKVSTITQDFTYNVSNGNTYGNARFNISDDGTTSSEFICYNCYYLGNRKFKAGETDIKVGDDVIVCGLLVNYKGNTPEFVGGKNFVYSLNGVSEGGGEAASSATPTGTGTEADPYNVAAAINAAKVLKYTDTKNYEKKEGVYAVGKISAIKNISWDASASDYYGNAEYSIVDEGYTAVLGVYRGFYYNGEKFTAQDQIKVGDEVLILGDLCNMFGNTPQFTTGSKIIKINGVGKEVQTVTGTITETVAAEDNSKVIVAESIVAAKSLKGVIVTDGTTNVYVYTDKAPEAAIGDKVKIEATKTTYYGLPEFTEPAITVLSSGNTVPRTELKDITKSIDSYASTSTDYLTATGTLVKDGDYYNLKVDGATRVISPSQLDSSIDPTALLNKRAVIVGYFNTINTGKNILNVIATEIKAADPNEKYCSVSTREIKVAASVTEASFNITANAAWTATSDKASFVVEPASGSADAAVKVTFPANETDEAVVANIKVACADANAEYTVVITQAKKSAAGEKNFVKVTTAPTSWVGTYLIVNEADKVAFDGKGTADAAKLNIAVEIESGAIKATEANLASVVTVEAMEGGYAIKTASGKYIYGKSGSNLMQFGSSQVLITISLASEGNAEITDSSANATIMYNSNSDQKRFRFYKAGSTQKSVHLYKLED